MLVGLGGGVNFFFGVGQVPDLILSILYTGGGELPSIRKKYSVVLQVPTNQ